MPPLALATTVPLATPLEVRASRPTDPPGIRLIRVLGRGGCATVYEALHDEFGEVAVKIGDTHSEVDSAANLRTMREADVTRRIVHPNVVQILDSGSTAEGTPFVVMERLVGSDLESVTIRNGPLDFEAIVAIGLDLLSAFAAVHAAGVVHRDLKPTNVMLVPDAASGAPTVKLIDFGVAHDLAASRLTQTGVVIGTPQYLAPEQARGDASDARVDIWAVGVLLYELLVGASPFDGAAVHEILAAILFGARIEVRSARKAVPEPLAAVVDRALERDPSARFESADAMFTALEDAARSCGIVPSYDTLRGAVDSTVGIASTWTERESSGVSPLVPRSGIRLIDAARTLKVAAPRGTLIRTIGIGVGAVAFSVVAGFAMGHGVRTEPRSLVVPMIAPVVAVAPTPVVADVEEDLLAPGSAAAAIRSEARIYVERGRDAYAHGRYESAYRDFTTATRIDRGYASAFRGLRDAAERTGRDDVARSAQRRYRSISRNGH